MSYSTYGKTLYEFVFKRCCTLTISEHMQKRSITIRSRSRSINKKRIMKTYVMYIFLTSWSECFVAELSDAFDGGDDYGKTTTWTIPFHEKHW